MAIAGFTQALVYLRDPKINKDDADLPFNIAGALNGLADAERLSGSLQKAAEEHEKAGEHYEKAGKHYTEALSLATAINYPDGVAAYTGNLAALALDLGQPERAEVMAREALHLSENVWRMELIASNCHRLAKALLRLGRIAEARSHARRAVEIFERLKSPYLAYAQATLAECEGGAPAA